MKTSHIFFDVDGVLNTENDWKKAKFSINTVCMQNFKEFIDQVTGLCGQKPSLIICSTWRKDMNRNGETDDNATSLIEEMFRTYGLTIDGSTPVSNKTRQEKIEYYIKRNHVKSYIIIDDDPSLFPKQKEIHLYVPDYHTGITEKDVKRMKKQFVKQNK